MVIDGPVAVLCGARGTLQGMGTPLRYALQDRFRRLKEWCEDQWFDQTRHVHTRGDVSLLQAGLHLAPDSELYVPARPWQVRYALRSVPVRDVSGYSYVDLGSGKGRTLFIASEMPFQRVVGVELSLALHAQALANAQTYRHQSRRCGAVNPLCTNATEFSFPNGPFVLYMFNPFGEATMRTVLRNLQASLARQPRHVVILLLWPRAGNLVLEIPGMRMVSAPHRWLQVFEVHRPSV